MVVNEEIGRTEAGTAQLGIHEGHSNVACALGSGKPLVIVCEPPGVHEGPALPRGSHGAVVAQKSATSALGREEESMSSSPVLSWPRGLAALRGWGYGGGPRRQAFLGKGHLHPSPFSKFVIPLTSVSASVDS